MDNGHSNIMNHMNNDKEFKNIVNTYQKYYMSVSYNHSSNTLNIGIRWYYWKYYKRLSTENDSNRRKIKNLDDQNINKHLGYDYKDLYVPKKYESFKTEILTHIAIPDYNDLILLKAQMYKDTQMAKQIWANDMDQFLHYGIIKGQTPSMAHLMSLIIYCDFPQFTKEFISTFSRKTKYESLHSIKQRNREFCWMSRMLRETVEYYGHSNRKFYHEYTWKREEQGPFWCVYNDKYVPGFNMRISSPLSTSKCMDVAINFINGMSDNGLLLQLNNNGHTWGKMLTMFDCSWISKYKSDDERVYFGGFEKIRIDTIIIKNELNEWINYQQYFHALYLFDNMVNGQSLFESDIEITYNDTEIIKQFLSLSYELIDEYIVQCWKLYKKNKIEVVINMNYLYLHFNLEQINQWIVRSLQRSEDSTIIPYENIISDVIFKTFVNMKELIIYSTSMTGRYSYQFSLNRFLEIICLSSSWREIKIIGIRFHEDCPSWIYYLFEKQNNKKQLIDNYKRKSIKIQLKQQRTQLFGGSMQDLIVINR